jgi:hypothetical protein
MKEDGYEILGRLHLLLGKHSRFLRLEVFLIIFGTLQLTLPCGNGSQREPTGSMKNVGDRRSTTWKTGFKQRNWCAKK